MDRLNIRHKDFREVQIMFKPVVLQHINLQSQQRLRQRGWRYFILVVLIQFFFILWAALSYTASA